MFFHLEIPLLAPSCPNVDPRWVSVPATKTQQASYVQSIVHQQSRWNNTSKELKKYDNFLKFWRDQYDKLERSWKTEYLNTSQDLSPALAQPCLPSPHCSPLRHAAGRTWNSKVTRDATDATGATGGAGWAQHFSVTQPRPSMRHSLGNQEGTQFWKGSSGLDVYKLRLGLGAKDTRTYKYIVWYIQLDSK